jgi:Ca2+-binding RTX toxin-like protein
MKRYVLYSLTRGSTGTEYGILLGLIAAMGVAGVATVGMILMDTFEASNEGVSGAFAEGGPDYVLSILSDDSVIYGTGPLDCVADTISDETFGDGGSNTNARCFVMATGGFDQVLFPNATDEVQITVDYSSAANGGGVFVTGDGPDRILYRAGYAEITTGLGADDMLIVEGFSAANMASLGFFSISSGKDVVMDGGNDYLTIMNVFASDGGLVDEVETVAFSDQVFTAEEFKAFILDAITTDDDDVISGSDLDDIISPQAGNDTIEARDGDDTIIYLSGNDTLSGGSNGGGNDTLDLSKYDRTDASFSRGGTGGSDIIITVPDGVITLSFEAALGSTNKSVDILTFSNPLDEMNDEDIMAASDPG